MKSLYLDPFSGVSGNMLLGTLFDLGLNFADFKQELAKLEITGYELTLTETTSSAIKGHLFEVTLSDEFKGHHADEGAGKIHHHGRNLSTIENIINNSSLSENIKKSACTVFEEIAKAEAHVHGKKIDEIHFHEVGAIDSIVDVVGFFIGLKLLKIEKVICGTLVDGSGTIKVAHGVMPVPVPAVMQMRMNSEVPFRQRADVLTELVTPTGFGIIKCITDVFGGIPENLVVEQVGYGFGTRETGSLNALRGILLESEQSKKRVNTKSDSVIEVHANIDDQSGEQLSFTMKKLFDFGVYDTFFTPIFSKKNRPAYQLTVLAKESALEDIILIIIKNSSTFGVRWNVMQRKIMQRKFEIINTKHGQVKIKIGIFGNLKKVSVEYASAEKIAEEKNLPIGTVMEEAKREYYKNLEV
ncbi:nickel pincer cofactor biosynthesis protein LarC [Liquorilactobacillus hordei]|uniref:Pyridinium-3,5-bisthiocarboxylic acid mononucleotide nickel insertion protein n=4 Tax=Liquorilactobacillus hordei TaxID=468911 RepID=A0A3Q8CKK6_9LACO|nr:nickel pincer cofactor biosynthesis protein LarC [Liquorilactobacillus hordei]AUJ30203.1 TIGR00299 family protein [Liquorilactobacillus hordei]